MNNPGIGLEIWKQLRQKWDTLDAAGHHLKIEFKLVTDPTDKNKILLIDVIQYIDEETITETVQHIAKEAYTPLGITNASMEQLIGIYRKLLCQAHPNTGKDDSTLIVTMSPTSATSGEVRAVLERANLQGKSCIQVDYRHYYILIAIREKMSEILSIEWSKVKAIYRQDQLDFYFEY